MPTYEYACKECGERLEVQQSFSDPSLTECPACGGPLRKVFGSIGIAFKGSGFYKTDSRTSKGKSKVTSDAGSSTSSSSSDGGSSSSAAGSGSSSGDSSSGSSSGSSGSGSSGSGSSGSGSSGSSPAGPASKAAAAS